MFPFGATSHDIKSKRGVSRLVLFMPKKSNGGQFKETYNIITSDETWIYHYDPKMMRVFCVVLSREGITHKCLKSELWKENGGSFFINMRHLSLVTLDTCCTVSTEWYMNCFPKILATWRSQHPKSKNGHLLLHYKCTCTNGCRNIRLSGEGKSVSVTSSSIFTWLGPMRLLFVSKNQGKNLNSGFY